MRLISITEADRRIADTLTVLGSEEVAVSRCHGRVLAQTALAERDLPPFDRSMMDGFAVNASACGRRARITGTAAAGQARQSLDDISTCIEIMTGAVLPDGADCVVPVEDVSVEADHIRFSDSAEITAGRFIHRQGSDHAGGKPLLDRGRYLGPAEIAVLASCNQSTVTVGRRPRVLIISTGDELIPPGEPIQAHQVRRSNDLAMTAAFDLAMAAETVERRHVADDRDASRTLLARGLADADLIVLSGGVSKGRYDYIPEVLTDLEVTPVFHRVALRPGKPLWFGRGPRGQIVFGLPGNPVSALTCLHRFVLPAARVMSGLTPLPVTTVRLAAAMAFKPDLTLLQPVRWSRPGEDAVAVTTNTSGDLSALAATAGFVELAAERERFAAGQAVPFHPWSGFGGR